MRDSYQEVQGPALEGMAGQHPLVSHLSVLPGLLTLTALQTAENKPGRTREAETEDEQHGTDKRKNWEELTINMTFMTVSFNSNHLDCYRHAS